MSAGTRHWFPDDLRYFRFPPTALPVHQSLPCQGQTRPTAKLSYVVESVNAAPNSDTRSVLDAPVGASTDINPAVDIPEEFGVVAGKVEPYRVRPRVNFVRIICLDDEVAPTRVVRLWQRIFDQGRGYVEESIVVPYGGCPQAAKYRKAFRNFIGLWVVRTSLTNWSLPNREPVQGGTRRDLRQGQS